MPVFDNELHDMTAAAKPAILEGDVYPVGGQLIEEFPYGATKSFRTDLSGVEVDAAALEARAERFGRQTKIDGTVDWTPLTSGDWKMQYLKPYLWLRDLQRELENDGEELTRDRWREKCRWSTPDALWSWLVTNGYVQVKRQGTDDFGFFLEEVDVVDVPPTGDQWAFELKPRDWQHAFVQAHRSTHGRNALSLHDAIDRWGWDDDTTWADAAPENVPPAGYANYAVVIMDAEHIGPAAAHASIFESAGVGLASLDRNGLREVVTPRRFDQPDYTKARLHLNERTLPGDFQL